MSEMGLSVAKIITEEFSEITLLIAEGRLYFVTVYSVC